MRAHSLVAEKKRAALRLLVNGTPPRDVANVLGISIPTLCVTPTVPGDDVAVAIDQDRDIEAKGLDAFGNLPDLPLGVAAWIGGVRLQIFDAAINNV